MKRHRRFIPIIIALSLMFPISSVYADSTVSQEYVNLLIEKMDGKSTEEIQEYKNKLKLALTDGFIGELKNNFKDQLTDKQLESITKAGITDQDLIDNIDALSKWSEIDRFNFVNSLVEKDYDGIQKLNNKYSLNDGNSSSGSSSNIGTGVGSGGSSVGGVSSNTNNSLAPNNVANNIVSKYKGAMLSKPIEVKQNLINVAFKDTEKHWAKENVDFFAKRGIVSGREDGKFYPNDSIQKSEIIKIMSNVFISDINSLETQNMGYKDVYPTDWFYPYVKNLYSIGVLEDQETLNPQSEPTREEIVDLMVKTLKSYGMTFDEEQNKLNGDFTDEDSINSKYKESFAVAIDLGIVKGFGDGKLNPMDKVTRAQVMTMTKNLYDVVIKSINNEGVKINE